MMNSYWLQYSVAALFLGLLVVLTDPFMYWMPDVAAMLSLVFAAGLAAVWTGLIVREEATDEREANNRQFAGRAAYLSGILVLTAALVIQGLNHAIDPWVSVALAAMVVSKLAARWYADAFK